MQTSELIELASISTQESDLLDFKREFSPEKKAAFWAETIKDIVAFANTLGGIIVFGVGDYGKSSDIDVSALFEFDNAALADQIRKYTNADVKGVTIASVKRDGKIYPAILIQAISPPLVFTRVGTYEASEGRQKTAFSLGTIYFRHGSKSEPCTREDLANCIDAALRTKREEWLGNIRKVVEAGPDATVLISKSGAQSGPVRITSDPNAPLVRLPKLSDGYPHRQSNIINNVNAKLPSGVKINSHDIQCIKCFEDISEEKTPHFLSKPHEKASPQYSDAFIELILTKFQNKEDYFVKCRGHWKNKVY